MRPDILACAISLAPSVALVPVARLLREVSARLIQIVESPLAVWWLRGGVDGHRIGRRPALRMDSSVETLTAQPTIP